MDLVSERKKKRKDSPPQSVVGSLLDLVSERKKKKKRLPTTICSGESFGLSLTKKKKKRLPTRICGGESFRLRKKKGRNIVRSLLDLVFERSSPHQEGSPFNSE